MRRTIVLFPLLALQAGCLSALIGSQEKKSEDYFFPRPGSGWEAIDSAEADAAFRNSKDQSILNVSSTCGQDRFRSLEDLSDDVFRQLPEHKVVAPSQATTIGGYPALVTEVEGRVDGSALQVRLAVVRTSQCLYDFMLAGPSLDSSSRMAFDRAIGGFRDKAR